MYRLSTDHHQGIGNAVNAELALTVIAGRAI